MKDDEMTRENLNEYFISRFLNSGRYFFSRDSTTVTPMQLILVIGIGHWASQCCAYNAYSSPGLFG